MYPKIITTLWIVLLACPLFAQEKGETSANRLFHIERSKNRNLVCYDINLRADGLLNLKQPLEVYWVNREERPGEVKGLSGMERRFAYGYKVTQTGDNTCKVTLSAYPGRELTIYREGDNYLCTIEIDGQQAILQKLYVKAKESNSLMVEYVELTGISRTTGQQVTERVAK
ncbi:MAG: DUF4833 domain-containing protein [Tannerellaceae bacterium]|nr:DUF4833 domain-containing protein [Tannerellaceae bacterium]MCD8265031.1 DUF4833 domain-containing protein [Tannerellaceae bacterium]